MARLGTLLDPKNPTEEVYVDPFFCVLSQEMRHISSFRGGPKWGGLGGGQKSLGSKHLCAVSIPHQRSRKDHVVVAVLRELLLTTPRGVSSNQCAVQPVWPPDGSNHL